MGESVSIAGRERTPTGWLVWNVQFGVPPEADPITWPGLGAIGFTTIQRFADPQRRVTMHLVETAAGEEDPPFVPQGVRLIRCLRDRDADWVAVLVPSVGSFDEARATAVEATNSRRLLVGSEDPDGGWWIGVVSSG